MIWGEDYDFPDGTDPRYPNRWGISNRNYQVLEDRLVRHLDQIGVKKLDFILGTHVHSDHIGGAMKFNRYQVDKFYLKKYSDQRITSTWGLWDNLFNYDNAFKAAQNKGVTLIQDISKMKDSHFKFGDMDIQLIIIKMNMILMEI